MVQRVQRFLGHSYTIQTWLDEDFLYVYFLWINIPNNPLGVSPPSLVAAVAMCWITTCAEILSCIKRMLIVGLLCM